MKKISVLLVLCLFAATVFAIDIREDANRLFDENNRLRLEYADIIDGANEQAEMVPGFILDIFGNERINIVVEMDDGPEMVFGVITSQRRLSNIRRGALNNPTMRINVDEGTIEAIIESDDPVGEGIGAFLRGKINYGQVRGNDGPVSPGGMASGIIGIIQGVVSFFGGLLGFFRLLP